MLMNKISKVNFGAAGSVGRNEIMRTQACMNGFSTFS